MKYAYILFLSMFFMNTYAQELNLYWGDRKAKLSKEYYYSIHAKGMKENCDWLTAQGMIVNATKDSLYINVDEMKVGRNWNTTAILEEGPIQKNLLPLAIAKDNILQIDEYNSIKHSKSEWKGGVGALLIVTGVGTLIHAFFVKGGAAKRLLYTSSAVQGAAGIFLATQQGPRTRYEFEGDHSWRFE